MMKKKTLSLLAIVMIMVIAAGSTLAYMSDKTNVLINAFAAAPELEAELKEPAWDGIGFGEQSSDHADDPDLGMNMAKAYTPNMVLPKDPTIRNNNAIDGMSEWVAIKVSYVDEKAVNARDYIKGGKIPYDQTNWLKLNSEDENVEYYIYQRQLAPQTTTEPLFDHIQIKAVLEESQTRIFHIKVSGFALQGTLDFEEAKVELQNMMK